MVTGVPPGLEEALTEHVFSTWDQDFLQTPEGQRGKQEVLVARYENALRFTIPWLARSIDLATARVVEIGCGSGSSTAALAQHARQVVGYDIDAAAVRAAAARCRAYGRTNVDVHACEPDALLARIRADASPDDVYVLYAVLEHQTWTERLDTLGTLWGLLRAGRQLVVVETPNRLVYCDKHSTDTDFYHLLPDELAFRYLDRVRRDGFRIAMAPVRGADPGVAGERRIRWGLGASFHEFELALDDPLDELVVADGFEREMTDFFPVDLDEELLTRFFAARVPDRPIGFARAVLNVILRKPATPDDRAAAAGFNRTRRHEITTRLRVRDDLEPRRHFFHGRLGDRYWWQQRTMNARLPDVYALLQDEEWQVLRAWFEETDARGLIGECSIPAISWLTSFVTANDVGRVVQLGTYAGYSTLLLGWALRRAGKGRALVSIDRDAGVTAFAAEWVRRAGLDDQVALVVGEAAAPAVAAEAVAHLGGPPSLVFVDSSHEYAQTRRELDRWFEVLAPGGMLVVNGTSAFAASLDATGQGGVKRAFEAWRRWRRAPAMSLAFPSEILAGWQQVYLDGGGVGLVVKLR